MWHLHTLVALWAAGDLPYQLIPPHSSHPIADMLNLKKSGLSIDFWRLCRLLVLSGGATSTSFAVAEVPATEPIDFNRDIRPILSQACFRCHGADANTRAADLRLDDAESAYEVRDGGVAISPGKIDESLVWKRIQSTDPDEVMPPPDSNRQLTSEEMQLVQRWIEQGAKYEKHWSFTPIPSFVEDTNIDDLLDSKIEKIGLKKTEAADPVTRLRRLSFTLTGLPPSIEEVQQFVKDPTAQQYELLVDRYLASPHYGEEMAKHWLDLARYGDTHGLHLDNERSMWAYRDWVINAFNQNQPYDEFTIDQIAGDQRPNATDAQWVATGFNRCNVTTGEGGAIDEEFLFRYAVDRTSTTVQTWLGLTAGCAVCHDHKYDPMTAKEFYSLYAFFYSAADPAMDGNTATTNPFRSIPTPQQTQLVSEAQAMETQAREALLAIASDRVRREIPGKGSVDTNIPERHTYSQIWLDDEMPVHGGRRNTSRNAEVWVEDVQSPMGKRSLFQSFGDRYEQFVTPEWPVLHVPHEGNLSFWVKVDRLEPPKAIMLSVQSGGKTQSWVWADSPENHALLDGGAMLAGKLPAAGVWTQIQVPLNGLPADSVVQQIKLGLFGGICSWDGLVANGQFLRKNQNDFVTWWEANKAKGQPWMDADIQAGFKAGPDAEEGKAVAGKVENYFNAYVRMDVSDNLLEARQIWQNARIQSQIAQSKIVGTFVFTDLPTPRETFVMSRGQYDAPGEAVQPATPSFLPKLSAEEGKRLTRLDFAQWLVNDENPLVARVAVNRFWQQVFGVGIVKTSDDFGLQGSPPLNPELLDQLADEFRRTNWDVKRLMKRLVLTAAFQRSSVVDAQQREMDPDNSYVARGPRIRLDAEQIRDNVLASAGLLNKQMGGPGFKSYQPANIWEPIGYGDSNTRYYIQDHGDGIYKRSIYAYIKRTAPPPFMTNFDAPNREQFCSVRGRSNTPLQALQLMNDLQYLEAARVLAESIVEQADRSLPEQITALTMHALSREISSRELQILNDAYGKFRARLEGAPEDARRIANWGERPPRTLDRDLDVAAMTLLANLVFNLDEFVNRN